MIKETCSCGATIEIQSHGGEREIVEEWRKSHQHIPTKPDFTSDLPRDWRTDPIQPYRSGMVGTYDKDFFTLNEDYVYNGEGEPVWIGSRLPPTFWEDWARHWTKPVDRGNGGRTTAHITMPTRPA